MSDVLPVDPTIGIRAEVSLADPDTCKFTVSRTLHPGGPFFFDNKERAAGSPLAERLFALPGVANVLIAESVVTIGKEPSASWSGLRAAVGTAHPDAAAHGRAGNPGDASQREHARQDRRRGSRGRSRAPGPGGQPFHRWPRRKDLDRGRPRRNPLHRDERWVPGLRRFSSDAATGIRSHGAQGRPRDRGHHRRDRPRGGQDPVLPAHRLGVCRS